MQRSNKRFNLKLIGTVSNRQWITKLLCLILLLPALSFAKNDSNTIVILGDSISAAYGVPTESGWVALLETKLKQKSKHYTVVNASISGETTEGGVKRLSEILDRHNPAILIIELGGNDGLRGFPLSHIKTNLQTMIDQAKSNNVMPILVSMRIPPNYGRRYTNGFYDLFEQAADKNDIALVPFLLEDIALKPELMQEDGIHPTALAQPIMLDRIWKTLAPLL
ncbi:arylesterase [Alkalimarinus sediminis]|uniref:Arylesterase n=1 Tax=Alkalimarinus sediminis TaxID=1632866 RepID=A0A9E8HL67_9ALTE|nr:arylesterase [Alkalimarinus sediminis]UZW76650.1 arylesterase [Alkalimarinus sediminis]